MMKHTAQKKLIKEFWDKNPCGGKWVSFREKVAWILQVESYILDFLRDDLVLGKHVLEVGCGQGVLLSRIAGRATHAIGMDISSESLEQAKRGLREMKLLDRVNLVQGDAENLPFVAESFDTVYSIGVLHHTFDTQKGIDEIYRVLRKDGKAVIMLYHMSFPKGMMVWILRTFSSVVDFFVGKRFFIADRLRLYYAKNPSSLHGTALLELFGCPILKMYSSRALRRMFLQFRHVHISYAQPGFSRILDIVPVLRPLLGSLFRRIDQSQSRFFAFYAMIVATK